MKGLSLFGAPTAGYHVQVGISRSESSIISSSSQRVVARHVLSGLSLFGGNGTQAIIYF